MICICPDQEPNKLIIDKHCSLHWRAIFTSYFELILSEKKNIKEIIIIDSRVAQPGRAEA